MRSDSAISDQDVASDRVYHFGSNLDMSAIWPLTEPVPRTALIAASYQNPSFGRSSKRGNTPRKRNAVGHFAHKTEYRTEGDAIRHQ